MDRKQWFIANEKIWEFDPIWASIRKEVEEKVPKNPILASYYHSCILNFKTLEQSLAFILSSKICSNEL